MEEKESCVLCQAIDLKNKSFVAQWEPFPVNIGHMKIMPKRHSATIFTFTEEEEHDFWDILWKVKKYLDESLGSNKPDGYNIGINVGESAGQTIEHLHIHVIPRYKGDIENPRGGVRNIKPALVGW